MYYVKFRRSRAATKLGTAAHQYATLYWLVIPVFPINDDGHCACGKTACGSPGKHPIGPLVPNGLRDATSDDTTIQHWWTSWPDAHVAIRTGAVSGVVALDIDADKGGWESAGRLEAAHGAFPPTPTVATGVGGAHVYFRHPGGTVPNSAGQIAQGIDLRGDGGYVIAPPSSHVSGTRYQWAPKLSPGDVDLADLPPWLQRDTMPHASMQKTPERLATEELLAEGGRNDRLMRLGAALRRYGLTESEIAAALHAINAARCRPPLDRAEVEKIAPL